MILRRLRLLLSYSPEKRRLILGATLRVIAVRLSLWLLPSRRVLRFIADRVERRPPAPLAASPSPARIAWAVRIGSRRFPEATCLTQALVTQLMLARHGYPSTLRIGVGRNDDGAFDAHAWVETPEGVVIGGDRLERYVPMPDLAQALQARRRPRSALV